MKLALLLAFWLAACASIFSQIQITNVAATNTSCTNNGTVTVSISGGSPPFCYRIDGGVCQFSSAFNYTFTGLFAGNHTVEVIDGNESATATAYVGGAYKAPTLSCTVAACGVQANVQNGQPPFQFSISINGGAFSAPQSSPNFAPVSGNYCVRLTDGCNNFTQFCGTVSVQPLNFKLECGTSPAPGQMQVVVTDLDGRSSGNGSFWCGGSPPYTYFATSNGNTIQSPNGVFNLPPACPSWTIILKDACGNEKSLPANCSEVKLQCLDCDLGTAQVVGQQGVQPFEYYFFTAGGQPQPNPAGINSQNFTGLPAGGGYLFIGKDACGNWTDTLKSQCLAVSAKFKCDENEVAVLPITQFFPATVACLSCPNKMPVSLAKGASAHFQDGVGGATKDTFLITDACGAKKIISCQTLAPGMTIHRSCNAVKARLQSVYQCNGFGKELIEVEAGATYTIAKFPNQNLVLQTNNTGDFEGLEPGATYHVVASHPDCGSTFINITLYQAGVFSLNYELTPTSFEENGICRKAFNLSTWLTPTPDLKPKFSATAGTLDATAGNIFKNVPVGNFTLASDNYCVSQNIDLPDFPNDLKVLLPDCPNNGCLQLKGAQRWNQWRDWGAANGWKIKAKDDFYILDCPDFNGAGCLGNWDGQVCNLPLGSTHTVYFRLEAGACPIDTATFFLDPNGGARIDSIRFSTAAACAVGTAANLDVQIFGGKNPIFIEVIDSISGQVISTHADIDTNHVIQIPNLAGGKNYNLRIVDGCGNSTDATALVVLLPDVKAIYQFQCPNRLKMRTVALVGANYTWRDPDGNIILQGLNRWTVNWFAAPAGGNYSVEIQYGTCPAYSTTVAVPDFSLPQISFPLDSTTICEDLGYLLQPTVGAGNYIFRWNTGDTTATLQISNSGKYEVVASLPNGCADTAAIKIEVAPDIQISNFEKNISCNGRTDGSLAATASGGSPPFDFLWNDGATDATRQNLPPGNYSLTVSDSRGCTSIFNSNLTEPPPLVLQIFADSATCFGTPTGALAAVATGGTGAFQFLWGDGSADSTLQNLPSGNFQVTATDANGCQIFGESQVEEPAILAATLQPKFADCSGGATGSLTATATGGTTPYVYVWSSGGAGATELNLPAGDYFLTLTDAQGCSTVVNSKIEEPLPLEIQLVGKSVGCFGTATGEISATATGGTPVFQFLWSDGQTSATAKNLPKGDFQLTVTDASGCTAVQNLTLDEPPLLAVGAVGSVLRCHDEPLGTVSATATGGTSPLQFLWSNAATTVALQNLTAGIFTVTTTDANGCTATAAAEVASPQPFIGQVSFSKIKCFGDSSLVEFAATGGVLPFVGTASQVLPAGNFDFTISDSNGCEENFSIKIDQPPPLEIVLVGKNVDCFGNATGEIEATATGGTPNFQFLWSDGQVSTVVKNLPKGNFEVTATDANGCQISENLTIAEPPLLEISATATPLLCRDFPTGKIETTATGGTPPLQFLWSNQTTAPKIENLPAEIFEVTTTDSNGCTAVASAETTAPPLLVASVGFSEIPCFGDSSLVKIEAVGGASPLVGTGDFRMPAGDFFRIVADSNGCRDTVVFQISQPQRLEIQSVEIRNAGCADESNGSLELKFSGGTAPFSAEWTTGLAGLKIENLPAGNYATTLTDAKNCTAEATATVSDFPEIFAEISTLPVACAGANDGELTFETLEGGAGAPYFFEKTKPLFAGLILKNLDGGKYEFEVSDAAGCTAEFAVMVIEPPVFEVELPESQVVFLGDAVEISAAVVGNPTLPISWQWTSPRTVIACDSCPTISVRPLDDEFFRVVATDARGCSNFDSVRVKIDPTCPVFVPNVVNLSAENGNDAVVFHAARCVERVARFAIFDRWGELVFEKSDFLPSDFGDGWDGLVGDRAVSSGVFVWFAEFVLLDGERRFARGDVAVLK